MPRNASAAYLAELIKAKNRPVFLFEAVFDDETVRNCDTDKLLIHDGPATVQDNTPNGYNGTRVGGVTFRRGLLGNSCLLLDGINGYVDIGNIAALDFDRLNPFSIEAKVLPVLTSATGRVFSKRLATGNKTGYTFSVSDIAAGDWRTHVALVNINPGNQIRVYGATDLNDGKVHHIAMTYTGSSTAAGVKIYVDGVEDTPYTVQDDNLTLSMANSASANIGAQDGAQSYLGGLADEVRVFNDVRTPTEINDNKDLQISPGTQGLIAYYRCNQGYQFFPNGHLIGFRDLTEDSDLKLAQVQITLSGVDQSWTAIILGKEYINRTVRIYHGFLDDRYEMIQDPIIVFEGSMDAPTIEEDPETGKVAVSVVATSIFATWEQVRGRRTNNTEQQLFFPDDKGFEFTTQLEKEVTWMDYTPPRPPPFAGFSRRERDPGDGGTH